MSALPKLIPFPGPRAPAESGESDDRRASLEGALAKVRQRWGYNSIVRLDGVAAPAAAKPVRRPKSTQELPPWWPRPIGHDGAAGTLRPRLLEVVAGPGSGRLTLSLAWLAAARPAVTAIVDLATPEDSPLVSALDPASPLESSSLPPIQNPKSKIECFYPPVATTAGLDFTRLIVVHPPAGDPRAPLDAVVVLLRSEAFDVVICPLPPRARISTSFAAKLATLAARANTSLLLLTSPTYTADGYASGHSGLARQAGVLASFADYRVRLTTRRWLWADGELAGLKLRAVTERARASSQDALYTSSPHSALSSFAPSTSENIPTAVEHDLTFRLHRRLHSQTATGAGADLLSLTTSRKLLQSEPAVLATAPAIPPLRILATG